MKRVSPRAVRPVPGSPPDTPVPPVARFTVGHGIEALLVHRPELPVVDIQVIVRAGAAADDGARAGRAALTAALLDQGTTTRSATDIAAAAESLGATLQTRASWDACTAALHVLTPRLEPALDLLADILLNPAFPVVEVERSRQRRLAAIMQERDEPRIVASQLFARAIYDDHPFGAPIGGTARSVVDIDVAEIRAFYQQHFSPAAAAIVAVGDVTPDSFAPMLEARFGAWRGTVAGRPAAPVAVSRQEERRIIVRHRPGAPQSELRVGRDGPPRATADYFPLLVGNTVLGGAFTSRLNILLRQEKGYTYGAGSSFAFRRDGGPFLASTAVSTAATADAVNDIVREIGRMSTERLPDAELDRARNYIMLGLPRTFETTADIAEHVGDIALYDLGTDYYESYAERVRAVDAAAVQAACETWLGAEALTIVVVGDADVVVRDLETLQLGAVNVRVED